MGSDPGLWDPLLCLSMDCGILTFGQSIKYISSNPVLWDPFIIFPLDCGVLTLKHYIYRIPHTFHPWCNSASVNICLIRLISFHDNSFPCGIIVEGMLCLSSDAVLWDPLSFPWIVGS